MDMNMNQMGVRTQAPSANKFVKWVLVIVAFLLVAAVVWYLTGSKFAGGVQEASADKYQAVFLTNGQVYFGKLSTKGAAMILTDIYYLQAASEPLQAGSDQPREDASQNIQLVKLGAELHGPEDTMYLQKENVLFWENMKADSKVVSAINKHKETNR